MSLIPISELDEEEEKSVGRTKGRGMSERSSGGRGGRGGGFALAGGAKLSHGWFAPTSRDGGRGRKHALKGGRSHQQKNKGQSVQTVILSLQQDAEIFRLLFLKSDSTHVNMSR